MTIVYNSKAGHTRRYAEMLAKAAKLKVFPQSEAEEALPQGEDVLFLGWVMAGHISGIDQAVRRWNVRGACGVGMTVPSEKVLADMGRSNYVPDGPLFYLQGGYDPKKVSWLQRRMVNMATKATRVQLQQKANRTPEEQLQLDMLLKGHDFVSFQSLKPLQDWLAEQP